MEIFSLSSLAQVAKMIRTKCPTLTFEDAEIELPENLNFLEKQQVKSSLNLAKSTYLKQRDWVSYEGKRKLHKDLNCV